jgi:CheY-like chemotaxis protein
MVKPTMDNIPIISKEFPLTILIAAINTDAQVTTKGALIKLGYQPEIAANGQDLLHMTTTRSYDVILIDIQMPEVEGMLALRQRDQQHCRPLFIAMTGDAKLDFRQTCLTAEMDHTISEPVDTRELSLQLKACSVLTGHHRIRADR